MNVILLRQYIIRWADYWSTESDDDAERMKQEGLSIADDIESEIDGLNAEICEVLEGDDY